jgi:hypothetical protein
MSTRLLIPMCNSNEESPAQMSDQWRVVVSRAASWQELLADIALSALLACGVIRRSATGYDSHGDPRDEQRQKLKRYNVV